MTPSDWKQWFIMKLMIIAFLIIAVAFDMPYGYYQIMRIALMWLFFKFTMMTYENEQHVLSVLCGLCLCLYQPLFKVALDKGQWINTDLIVIAFMLVWSIIVLIITEPAIIKTTKH